MSLYSVKQRGHITEYDFIIPDTKLAFANMIWLAHSIGGRAFYRGASKTNVVIFKGGHSQMENEIRFYLKAIQELEDFEPKYIVTAVRLESGAVELIVNTEDIKGKIDYLLKAYNDEMQLIANTNISIENIMVI